ncbi:unnamed protein product [Lymnaea stagnalis]|uniref:Uncharacterized protein n=1 Tax=Lymnaea stagnalis TaxID=6523 RepID=A0AAV2HY95_LYMST
MRGLSRTDSLLFLYKIKNETRRFRVRFCQQNDASGIKICEDVIRVLSSFITIKMSTMENKQNVEDSVKNNKESSLGMNNAGATSNINITGEITIGVMAKAVLNKHQLPLAYYQCQPDPETISVFLRTCLADPTFPKFVEAVEDGIKALIEDSSEKA